MALHFLVTDDSLRDHHGRTYHRRGRWILSAAVIAGAGVGYAFEEVELLVAVSVRFWPAESYQRDQGGTAVGS